MEHVAAFPSMHFPIDSLAPRACSTRTCVFKGGGAHGRGIGLSMALRGLWRPWRSFLGAPFSSTGWNWSAECWEGVHCRASGDGSRRKGKGDGKAKPGPGKKKQDDRGKKDNVWSFGTSTVESNGAPDKKDSKTQRSNVAGYDSSSGKGKGGEGSRGREGGQGVPARRDRDGNTQLLNSRHAEDTMTDDGDDPHFPFLSPVLPIEEEIVLQDEEPIPDPVWQTFCSSTSGVWRGVGAAFSPITGAIEPLSLNDNKEFLYDARVLSTVQTLRTAEDGSFLVPDQHSLYRRVLWSTENPLGEQRKGKVEVQHDSEVEAILVEGAILGEEEEVYWVEDGDTEDDDDEDSDWESLFDDPGEIDERWEIGEKEDFEVMEELEEDTTSMQENGAEWTSMWGKRENLDGDWEQGGIPAGEGDKDFGAEQSTSSALPSPSLSTGLPYTGELADALGMTWTDVMEEDHMNRGAELIFFEDGAYSRGPLELLTESSRNRGYFNTYTCKIEQCLVAGGHKRLRVIHTISVEPNGEVVEVLRVAVYEEEWMGPCNMEAISDVGGHRLKLFSDRDRHLPEDLVGTWKVFGVEAMAVHRGESAAKDVSFVYSCKEKSIKRVLPEMPSVAAEEDMPSAGTDDLSMLWLTGNISTYVTVGENDSLTFGIGWLCNDGTRLVMERVYGGDGRLSHVNSKSEIKGGWAGGRM